MFDRRRAGSGKVTPGEQISEARRIPIPSLGEAHEHNARKRPDRRDNEEHRAMFEKGLQTGLARGRQEGAAAARQRCEDEARETAQAAGGYAAERLARMIEQFEADFNAMETALADKTLDLAVTIARRVLFKHIEVDKTALEPVVRECLVALGAEATQANLHLHPDDLELLENQFSADIQPPLKLSADATITPGGCRLTTAQSLIDGSLETRWERALKAMGISAPLEPEADS